MRLLPKDASAEEVLAYFPEVRFAGRAQIKTGVEHGGSHVEHAQHGMKQVVM